MNMVRAACLLAMVMSLLSCVLTLPGERGIYLENRLANDCYVEVYGDLGSDYPRRVFNLNMDWGVRRDVITRSYPLRVIAECENAGIEKEYFIESPDELGEAATYILK